MDHEPKIPFEDELETFRQRWLTELASQENVASRSSEEVESSSSPKAKGKSRNGSTSPDKRSRQSTHVRQESSTSKEDSTPKVDRKEDDPLTLYVKGTQYERYSFQIV
jgi:hypothetical protein